MNPDRNALIPPKKRVTFDRSEAAAMLCSARTAADPAARDEAVDWAFAVMSERPAVQRLKIRQLLASGDFAAADAVLGSELLKRPTDATLTLLRAESLWRQGRLIEADNEIGLVIDHCRHRPRALKLAGRIALARKDANRAIRFSRDALRLRPQDEQARTMLVEAWLEEGSTAKAEQILAEMKSPEVLLQVKLLRQRRRLLDAVELLEGELASPPGRANGAAEGADDRHSTLVAELIELLERIGDQPRLVHLLDRLESDRSPCPRLKARIARGWLALGRFRTALRTAATLRRPGQAQAEALRIMVIASSMLGRPHLAGRALARLQRTDRDADAALMTDLWRRALTARLIADQADGRRAGADRNGSLLQPLLTRAIEIFQHAAVEARDRLPRRSELARHEAVCLYAMGRAREAAAVLHREAEDEGQEAISCELRSRRAA